MPDGGEKPSEEGWIAGQAKRRRLLASVLSFGIVLSTIPIANERALFAFPVDLAQDSALSAYATFPDYPVVTTRSFRPRSGAVSRYLPRSVRGPALRGGPTQVAFQDSAPSGAVPQVNARSVPPPGNGFSGGGGPGGSPSTGTSLPPGGGVPGGSPPGGNPPPGGPPPGGPNGPPPTPTPPVPEPATWIMMILGFGVVGQMLRRNRRSRGAALLSAAEVSGN
jgi:PEP-CTERM motif